MIIKWVTGGYSRDGLIRKVECQKETEKTVVLQNGSRTNKSGGYEQYHDTWQQALDYLSSGGQARLIRAKRQLEIAEKNLAEISALEAPE